MTKKNTAIDGDLSISSNVTTGGDHTVRGNAKIEHNLSVYGWLNAPNIIGTCKGLFASLDKLKEEYPKPENGWWALVGDTVPAEVYRVDDGQWKDTGEKGSEYGIEKITTDQIDNLFK